MRCHPANEDELARILHYRNSGKSPGMPKWYHFPKLPATLKYSMAQRYPRNLFTRPLHTFMERCSVKKLTFERGLLPQTDDVAQYVREFERMTHLVPTA